jgi:hypothetical protein
MPNDPSGQRDRDMGRLQSGANAEDTIVGSLLLHVLRIIVRFRDLRASTSSHCPFGGGVDQLSR